MEEYKVPTDEDKKAFQKYIDGVEKKKKETSVLIDTDDKEIKAASNELKLQKRGYKYEDEDELDSKRKIAESLPHGRLGVEEDPPGMDLGEEEIKKEIARLEKQIAELNEAMQTLSDFLAKPEIKNFDFNKLTLGDLKTGIIMKELPNAMEKAADIIIEHGFDDNMNIWDLTEEIKEVIDKDKLILENLKNPKKLPK